MSYRSIYTARTKRRQKASMGVKGLNVTISFAFSIDQSNNTGYNFDTFENRLCLGRKWRKFSSAVENVDHINASSTRRGHIAIVDILSSARHCVTCCSTAKHLPYLQKSCKFDMETTMSKQCFFNDRAVFLVTCWWQSVRDVTYSSRPTCKENWNNPGLDSHCSEYGSNYSIPGGFPLFPPHEIFI